MHSRAFWIFCFCLAASEQQIEVENVFMVRHLTHVKLRVTCTVSKQHVVCDHSNGSSLEWSWCRAAFSFSAASWQTGWDMLGNASEQSMRNLRQPSMFASSECRWHPVQMTTDMQALLADAPALSMAQSCIGALAHYHRCTAAVSHLKARSMDSFGSLIAPVSFH